MVFENSAIMAVFQFLVPSPSQRRERISESTLAKEMKNNVCKRSLCLNTISFFY